MKQRSEKDIRQWLKTRLWYKRYKNNLMTEKPNEAYKYLNGDMGPYTLSSPFKYKDTPEGVKYWIRKEEKFLAWYYNKYLFFKI